MHHQVAVRQALVDFADPVHGQDFAIRLARELVGAVAGADGDGQRVDAGLLDEIDGLVRVGEVGQRIDIRAVAVLDAAEAAKLAFDGHALGVRHLERLRGSP